MKRIPNNTRKFCFISNSDQSYLADYVDLSHFDSSLDFSFDNINLTELKNFNPNIIIIDQYFCKKDYSSIIEIVKLNFKKSNIYFFSPEYANYNNVIQSVNNKKHYYSNFSVDILNHINSLTENGSYLEAS
ncbi:MAG: hypothetical protein HRT73_07395 [Flavobacteriales bacterium]|nr:hypothetical protein [Flavobacteriales bacterium]